MTKKQLQDEVKRLKAICASDEHKIKHMTATIEHNKHMVSDIVQLIECIDVHYQSKNVLAALVDAISLSLEDM